MSFLGMFKKVFGTKNEREVKRMRPLVARINDLEPQMQALKDEDFPRKIQDFKQRHANGESLDKLLPETFALVREASVRTTGMRHFDVQMIGGMGKKSEHVAIFYLTSKYDLIESRTFWLSPTPDQVSIGWDAALNRICTYGHFKDRATGAAFHVFNCHFDHQGKQAREKSAEVILAKMKEWKLLGKNLVLTGDFNSVPTSKAIATIEQVLADSRKVSLQQSYGPAGTFNGFDLTAELDNPIDYIFVKNLRILNHRHIDDRRRNGLWVSDHLPVFATIITE